MPTIPLKRPSTGGLRRLLASLRQPARAGPLPVQTGFPTSLADIVVKNHSRLRNPRRRHRATAPPHAAVADAEPQQRSLSVDHDASAVPVAAEGGPVPTTTGPGRGGAVCFSIRPGILAAGGAVALALLLVIWWSKQLVAAATFASVALSWIESFRSDRRGGLVSPILDREVVESSPRRQSCGECGSDDGGSDAVAVAASLLWSADSVCDGLSSAVNKNNPNTKVKQSRRRSLRKLLADKLRNGSKTTPRDGTDSRHGGGDAGEPKRPETLRRVNAEPAAADPAEETSTPTPRPPEATTDDDDDDRYDRHRRGQALLLPALVPIILAGLVAGKLPALALAVLCAAFSSSSVERVPAGAGKGSSRYR